MRTHIGVLLLITSFAASQTTPSPNTKQQPGTQPTTPSTPSTEKKPDNGAAKSQRVRVHLEGFELDKNASGKEQTQIGGATRGVVGLTVTLYAPHKGKAFTTTPTFFWSPAGNASTYHFRLQTAAGEPVYEADTKETSLHYPDEAPKLVPGQSYRWTVQPRTMLSHAAAPAELAIIDGAERQQLQARLASLGAAQADGATIQTFMDARLWYDALASLDEALLRSPQRAELYEQRALLYSQLPPTEHLAEEDLARAEVLKDSK